MANLRRRAQKLCRRAKKQRREAQKLRKMASNLEQGVLDFLGAGAKQQYGTPREESMVNEEQRTPEWERHMCPEEEQGHGLLDQETARADDPALRAQSSEVHTALEAEARKPTDHEHHLQPGMIAHLSSEQLRAEQVAEVVGMATEDGKLQEEAISFLNETGPLYAAHQNLLKKSVGMELPTLKNRTEQPDSFQSEKVCMMCSKTWPPLCVYEVEGFTVCFKDKCKSVYGALKRVHAIALHLRSTEKPWKLTAAFSEEVEALRDLTELANKRARLAQ